MHKLSHGEIHNVQSQMTSKVKSRGNASSGGRRRPLKYLPMAALLYQPLQMMEVPVLDLPFCNMVQSHL
jgi:hypothetical protein